MSLLDAAIARRRTFAIISHPDAGKTTLTEKLLLFGGAIQEAGAVKARGNRRRATSDWMNVEKKRGISVTSAVMTFDFEDHTYNLLDTPGHEDFSEDTYRTLTAVDSAVMILDAAKGIETQTRKLFEVCRLRNVPIITFINKMDREGREPVEILDEIEQSLQLEVTPADWPIGGGQDFRGCYDLRTDKLVLMDRADRDKVSEGIALDGLGDPRLEAELGDRVAGRLREGVEMSRELCPPFDLEAYRGGHLTPVFFGSALYSFGVRELLRGLGELAPAPRPQPAAERTVAPDESKVSAFVFKVQANMDPKHRDRIAFCRMCSGHFQRGMKLHHVRSGKTLAIHNPVLFMARDRELAEEAWPGDIIGIPNHGNLRIGDALTEGENLRFMGIPSFAPELLQRVRAEDPIRAKHLGRALQQLAEEGAAQAFKTHIGGEWVVGVGGALQFDVLADRIATEYDVPVRFEATSVHAARWVRCADAQQLKKFADDNRDAMAIDHDDDWVFLARNEWHLETTTREWPDVELVATKDHA
jgi:peptide chain release factor 3